MGSFLENSVLGTGELGMSNEFLVSCAYYAGGVVALLLMIGIVFSVNAFKRWRKGTS